MLEPKTGAGRHRGTVSGHAPARSPGRRGGRRRRRPVHGAVRRARGRARDAGLGHAAGRAPRATGRRAGSRPRCRPTTAPSSICRTRSPPAATPSASRRRGSSARRPRRGRRPRPPRRQLRRRPRRAPRARARGRPLALAGSSTPAAPPPGAGCPPAQRARRRGPADRGARGTPRCRVLQRRRPLRRASRSTTARVIARGAVVLATGGAAALWARTTNPAGAVGGGLLLATAAGATLADLELVQFHPTAVVGPTAPTGSSSPRRSAARAPGCSTPPASGSSTSSRRATRSRARSSARCARPAPASVGLDMRDVDPALFPNVVSALRQAGIDPERELVPVAPAAHYMMGGIATDLDARATLAGPVRGRRVLVHGAARRQPARLELADRVLRVRRPRGARRRLEEPARSERASPTPASPGRAAAAGDLTASSRARCGATPGSSATATGLRSPDRRPHPLVRLIAALRARPHREPRRPPAARLPRPRPGSTAVT